MDTSDGIKCGYAGCIEIEFLRNHRFRKIYPNGEIYIGSWNLKNDVLTIRYDKKEREGKKNIDLRLNIGRKKNALRYICLRLKVLLVTFSVIIMKKPQTLNNLLIGVDMNNI